MKYAPIPSRLKIVSVMIAPPISVPTFSAITFSSGIRAFRNACFSVTRGSLSPFARAVRM
jgi:hypothetical protein